MLKIGDFNIPALVLRDNEISPGTILQEIEMRIAYLDEIQHPHQSPLCVVATSELSTIYWMFASFLSGRIFVPFPPKLTKTEEEYYLSFFSKSTIVIKGDEKLHPPIIKPKFSPCSSDDMMAFVFSSGSTGKATPIALTFTNFLSQAKAHKLHNAQTEKDIWLASLPLYHVGGINIFTRAMFLNQEVAFDGIFETSKYRYWLENSRITCFSLVPTQLYRLLHFSPEIQLNTAIKMILVGGGPIDSELVKLAHSKNWPVILTYGMTETCSQIYTGDSPLPGITLKISESKEILIKSPTLSPTIPKDDEGYFASGDLGLIDDQGKLQVLGRMKTLINSGGIKIAPEEIEAAMLKHPDISEAAVWGTPHAEWGEALSAAYVSSQNLTSEEVLNFLKNELSSKKIPKIILRVNEIPRTNNGKIKRDELLSLLANDKDNH
mgnify:CR=1 FL=1